MSIVQIIITVLSCIIFFGRLFFGIFKKFSPFKKNLKEETDENNRYSATSFAPNLTEAELNNKNRQVASNAVDTDIEIINDDDLNQARAAVGVDDIVTVSQPTSSNSGARPSYMENIHRLLNLRKVKFSNQPDADSVSKKEIER